MSAAGMSQLTSRMLPAPNMLSWVLLAAAVRVGLRDGCGRSRRKPAADLSRIVEDLVASIASVAEIFFVATAGFHPHELENPPLGRHLPTDHLCQGGRPQE